MRCSKVRNRKLRAFGVRLILMIFTAALFAASGAVVLGQDEDPCAKADRLFLSGNPRDALDPMEACEKANPDDPVIKVKLGEIYFSLNLMDQAQVKFQDALLLDPGMILAYNDMALVLYQRNDLKGALELLQKAAGMDPGNQIVKQNIEYLEKMLSVENKETPASSAAGPEEPEAAQAARPAAPELEVKPENQSGEAFQSGPLAALLERKKDDIAHKFDSFRMTSAQQLLATGQCDKALEMINKNIEETGETPNLLTSQGAAYDCLHEYEKSAESHRKALEKEPNHAVAHNNLGHALFMLGDSDQSEAEYRKAIEIDPQYIDAWINLGNLFLDRQDFMGAIENFQKAIGIDSESAAAYNNIAYAYFQNKQYDDALSSLERAKELEPDNPTVDENIAQVKQAMSQSEQTALAQGNGNPSARANQGTAAASNPSPEEKRSSRNSSPDSNIVIESMPRTQPGTGPIYAGPGTSTLPVLPDISEEMRNSMADRIEIFYEKELPSLCASDRKVQGSFLFGVTDDTGNLIYRLPGDCSRMKLAALGTQPSPTADGGLVFVRLGPNQGPGLYVLKPDKEYESMSLESDIYKRIPRVSADGRKMAYVAGWDFKQRDLWVMDLNTDKNRAVTTGVSISDFSWDPVGDRIYVATGACYDDKPNLDRCLGVVDLNGSDLRYLNLSKVWPDPSAPVARALFYPEGSKALVIANSQPVWAMVVDLVQVTARKVQLQLPKNIKASSPAAISPDGANLAFARNGELWIVPIGAGEPFLFATRFQPFGPFSWTAK